ncbi:MAG: terminase [Burkholderiaceae bacterium]|nr:terminase [Burkholderiaceae bacterium]
MAPRNKVGQLPAEVRDWLDKALLNANFGDYVALEEALRAKGFAISKSSIHRYGQKIERRLAAIKASTEAARLLTEGAADDQDARSEAVIALVQTEMFESIVNLQEATEEDIDPAERIGLLSSAAKNIATLARASVNQKKFRQEVQARAQAAAENVEKIAKKGGLSAESVSQLRREILGIAQ